MAKVTSSGSNYPPFPALDWKGHYWLGKIVLQSWKGFQARQGPYGSRSSKKSSSGSVSLIVPPPDGKEKGPPTPEQAEAYQYLLAHEQAISTAVRSSIYEVYPDWREEYGLDEEEAAELMPDIEGPDQLKTLIGLANVHILPVAKDGVGYVGFELGCTWDDEHGLGVMMHKDRVVKLGGADSAFLEWIAEADARSSAEEKPKGKRKK